MLEQELLKEMKEQTKLLKEVLKALKKPKPKKEVGRKSEWSEYVESYFKHYEEAYDTKALFTAKERGQLIHISKALTSEEFDKLFQVYLQMEDDWFQLQNHSLGVFYQNMQKVVNTAYAGRELNMKDRAYYELKEKLAKRRIQGLDDSNSRALPKSV